MRALLFDLGGVLVELGFEQAITDFQQLTSASRAEIEQFLFAGEPSLAFEEGRLSSREYFAQLCQALQFRGDYATFVRLWNAWVRESPQMSRLLQALAAQYPVSILSNTNSLHIKHLLNTCALFREVNGTLIASCWVGARKPQARIYELAVARMGIPAEHIVYIDDRPEWVAQGNQCGLRAVHFTGHDALVDTLRGLGMIWNHPVN